jgi:hypothetical protein
MTIGPHLTDAYLDANRLLLAAEVLVHPFALQLMPASLDALAAIAAEEPWVRPEDARRVLRLAITGIDSLEIAASLGVAA